jgi:hypothetical protein
VAVDAGDDLSKGVAEWKERKPAIGDAGDTLQDDSRRQRPAA